MNSKAADIGEMVVDQCEQGHKFAKLPDHPKRDGIARCPHCLAIGREALLTHRDDLVRKLGVAADALEEMLAYSNARTNPAHEKALTALNMVREHG